MGRTSQPLTIWVASQWLDHPAVVALKAQGHRVEPVMGLSDPDLILSPAAHWWSEDMWDYLPAALTAARKRRKAK